MSSRLQVTQNEGGYVLRYGGIVAGGDTFIAALRDLYRRVDDRFKPMLEEIGIDAKLESFIDGFKVER